MLLEEVKRVVKARPQYWRRMSRIFRRPEYHDGVGWTQFLLGSSLQNSQADKDEEDDDRASGKDHPPQQPVATPAA